MNASRTTAALLGLAIVCAPGIGFAAEAKVDMGKQEYDSNCAVCHGPKGKGDGPYAGLLTRPMPDLTLLAKSNGGVFPMARVYEVIDGQREVKAHGPRDMPVWGRTYKRRAGEYYVDVPYDAEAYARVRILALAEYLYRLQAR